MSAHTPGPWECFYKQKYDEWHVSLPLAGQTMRLGLFEDGCPTERPEADARLIAAAPELLEVLQLVVDLASQEWQESDGSRKCATDNQGRRLWFISPDMIDEVRAAIAKATGEKA